MTFWTCCQCWALARLALRQTVESVTILLLFFSKLPALLSSCLSGVWPVLWQFSVLTMVTTQAVYVKISKQLTPLHHLSYSYGNMPWGNILRQAQSVVVKHYMEWTEWIYIKCFTSEIHSVFTRARALTHKRTQRTRLSKCGPSLTSLACPSRVVLPMSPFFPCHLTCRMIPQWSQSYWNKPVGNRNDAIVKSWHFGLTFRPWPVVHRLRPLDEVKSKERLISDPQF